MKICYFLPLLCLALSIPAYSGLYRWVDESGKVHYGDRIPPIFAQQGHVKLNKNGTTKEKVESAEVRKIKIEQLKHEKARQARLKQQKQAADLQEMRDTQLLSMFSSADELIRVYESKLEMTDGSIKILKARHKKLSKKLEALENRHEKMLNPNDKNKVGMKIEDILDNLHIYQQAITDNLIERSKIEERYEVDLARYKLLTRERTKSSAGAS